MNEYGGVSLTMCGITGVMYFEDREPTAAMLAANDRCDCSSGAERFRLLDG